MSERSTVNTWLKGLWTPTSAIELDASGSCAIEVDPVTLCYIEVPPGEGRVDFFCPVAPLPETDATDEHERGALFARCLAMNLPGGASRGGSLAVDLGLTALVLRFSRPLEGMDGVVFGNTFGGVIDAVRAIRRELYGEDGTEVIGDGIRVGGTQHPGLDPGWIRG